ERISKRDLWLMGIMLYWAEGAKEKQNSRAAGVEFGNSDSRMVFLYIKWLVDICKVPRNQIKYDLYVHEAQRENVAEIKRYWIRVLSLKTKELQAVYFKKNKRSKTKKRIVRDYHGLLRVRVKSSSSLNRKISGWIDGIADYWRVG
ncbi:MAG: hypothetical protein ABH810_00865, partial [bacterium]